MLIKCKKLFTMIISFAIIICTVSFVPVQAASQKNSSSRVVSYVIVTAIGPQVFNATHYYGYSETYTSGGSYIRYTNHSSSSYIKNWTGWYFGSIEVYNAHSADYYNSNNTYIKSANMYKDQSMIADPSWQGYESANGTDIATVNTSSSTAKATFSVFCPEALACGPPLIYLTIVLCHRTLLAL